MLPGGVASMFPGGNVHTIVEPEEGIAYQLLKGSPLRAFPGAPLRILPVAGL